MKSDKQQFYTLKFRFLSTDHLIYYTASVLERRVQNGCVFNTFPVEAVQKSILSLSLSIEGSSELQCAEEDLTKTGRKVKISCIHVKEKLLC